MFTKILVAYDGGNIARKALDKAVELVRGTAAEIHLLTIYSDHDIQSWRLQGSHYPSNAEELFHPHNKNFLMAEEAFVNTIQADASEKVRQAGITVHSKITKGKPDTVIVEYANKIGADLIVTGTQNHGKAAQMLLGSVSSSIIRNAPCPVMVVREV